ncbi:sensor histidine kinase [Streptomonospora mangrovi]|uniref:sensor histidine kinase n=1 Tax=Streptomonospora mangrovi TaxID=2883123 RepID=UPI002FD7CD13
MTSERTEEAQGELRTTSLGTVSAALSAVGALLVVTDAQDPWQAALLATGLVAAMFAVQRWTADRASRAALPLLGVTAAVWTAGMLVTDTPTASYAFAVAATVVVRQRPRHRRAVLAVPAAFAAAVVAARLATVPGGALGGLVEGVFAPAAVAAAGAVLTLLNQAVHELLTRLELAREREAELAVSQERIRFAGDLHDIQGHTLHVVKLKVALAEKLLRADVDRAEAELREVRALVGDTITQTKELAYAQRRLNLAAELENAKNLFEAAGIAVRVEHEAEAAPRAGELLGLVLRETTTNILRHAQARHVRITLSATGLVIVNDGAGRRGRPR